MKLVPVSLDCEGVILRRTNSAMVSAIGTLLALSLMAVPRLGQSAEPVVFPASPDQYVRVIRGNLDTVTIYNALGVNYAFFYQGPLVWNSTVDVPGNGITVAVEPTSGTLSNILTVALKIEVSAATNAVKGVTTGKITFTTSGIYDPLGQYLNTSDARLRVEVAADNSVRIYSSGGSYLECDAGSTATKGIRLINSGPDRLYQWKVVTDVPWLSISPASGDFIKNFEEGGYTYSETNLTLTASAGALLPGDYTGKLVVTAANLKAASYEYAVSLKVKPASTWNIFGLDQKLLVRGSDLRLVLHGVNLKVPVTPAFLMEDGSVDSKITFASVAVNGTDRIEAVCTTAPDATLGGRTLLIQSEGKEARLTSAVQVVGFRLEINQGAKTEPEALRVGNHPTVVRAFVDSAGPVGDLVGRLYVFDESGLQIAGSPFSPNAPAPKHGADGSPLLEDVLRVNPPYTRDEQLYLRNSLNFYNSFSPGRYDFRLAASATDPSRFPPDFGGLTWPELRAKKDFLISPSMPIQDFRKARPYRVLALIDNRLALAAARQIESRLGMASEYLNAAFPGNISLHTRDEVSKEMLNLDALKPSPWNLAGNWWANVHARLARYLAVWNENSTGLRYDQIVLATDATGVQAICGSGTLGMADKHTAFIAGDYPTTFAHELAHNLGLGDTYCGFGCGNLLNLLTPCYTVPLNCRRGDALPGGNRVEDGAVRLAALFDSRGKRGAGATACVAWPGYQRIDLMGTANDENRWPDLVEWNHLFGALQASPSVAQASVGGDCLSARGVIGIDDSVEMMQFAKETQPDLGGSLPNGDYRLELVDASGATLSSQPFGVDFRASGAGLATSVSFAVSTHWVNGAAMARIRHATRVLASQPISGHAPIVAVTDPASGRLTNSPITVRWTGSDADGDSLTFTLFYIKDDGSPVPLAADLTTTSYSWNPGRGGGCSQGRIVVVASDGINQGRGESAPFSLARQPPTVGFLAPVPDTAVPAGVYTTLSGAGTDPEDGFLPPASLSFRSSIDGDLGQGAVVSKVLSVGAHKLTLRGVDQDGNQAEASIDLTVGPANQVPVVEFVAPSSSAPGTSVTLAGRNFDLASMQVRFGALPATVISATSTQSVVRVPDGLPPGVVPVSVVAHGFASEPVSITVSAGKPRILGFAPAAGAPGTPVMVRISEFDPASNPTVRFGDLAAVTLGISGDGMLVAVPAGVVTGDILVTVVSPPTTSDPVHFQVLAGDSLTPTRVRMILPDFGAVGDVVRFIGSGFSPVLAENVVSLGGVPAAPISASEEELRVQVPGGITAGPVMAWVSVRQYPSNPLAFTARTPSDPNVALSIVITGSGFEISWPATSTEYVLEVADQVLPVASWQSITVPISVRAARKVAELPVARTTRFFRLRKEP